MNCEGHFMSPSLGALTGGGGSGGRSSWVKWVKDSDKDYVHTTIVSWTIVHVNGKWKLRDISVLHILYPSVELGHSLST